MHFPIFFTNLLYSIGHQIIWLKYLRFLIWFSHLLWTSTSWERVARFSVSIFSYFDPIWAPDNHLVLIFLNLVSSFAEMIDHTIKKMLTHYSHWVYSVHCSVCNLHDTAVSNFRLSEPSPLYSYFKPFHPWYPVFFHQYNNFIRLPLSN